MERLIQQDDFGNWSLKGVPWKDIYSGKEITANTEEKIYVALCKLKEYEESDLMPEQVNELKERYVAKKVQDIKYLKDFNGSVYKIVGKCPGCGCETYNQRCYCDDCGQKLDWSE